MTNGVNSGILVDAYPLSTERIKELEKEVLENNDTYAYLDENGKLCFTLPNTPECIRQLAWNFASELTIENNLLNKKVYMKTGLDSYRLFDILQKQNYADSWSSAGSVITELEGTGAEYHTTAPSVLSFRSTAPLNELQEVQINGQSVDSINYTLEEGSTIVKLSPDFLETLDTGKHEISVVSNSQKAMGEFNVVAPELNEYGFYYNLPYSGEFDGEPIAIIFTNQNFADIEKYSHITGTVVAAGSTDTSLLGMYVVNGNSILVTTELETDISDYMEFGTINEPDSITVLGSDLMLGNDNFKCDAEYVYAYSDEIAGYTVYPIMRDKDEYHLIKDNILGIPVKRICENSFRSGKITRFIIPDSITSIGDHAFERCASLSGLVLSNHLTSIGNSAFYNCNSLTSVTIPDSVISIGDSAFYFCALSSVTIGNSVISIGDSAFSFTSLTSITIPNSVTSIGNEAFSGCTRLTSLTIGNGVTSIGDGAFYNCDSLTTVNYKGSQEDWNKINIGSSNDTLLNATIVYNYS